MNKFVAIALLAYVAVAAASPSPLSAELDTESQLSLNPSDSEETAGLEGPFQIFSDFCISTRDYVVGDIKQNTNGAASNVFGTFFSSATSLGLEAVNVQKEAAEKLGEQIRNPSAPIGDYDHNDEIASLIAEGQKEIQEEQNQPKTLLSGFVSTLAATKNAVTSRVLGQLSDLKKHLGMGTLIAMLNGFCDRADRYDQEIMSQFEAFKANLNDPSMASVKLENVPCLTARRVIRVDGICKFANAAKNPLIKAVSYKPVEN